MATNIPPHNLSELVDAITLWIDKPNATVNHADGGEDTGAGLPDLRV